MSPKSNKEPSVEAPSFSREVEALFDETGFRSSPELTEVTGAVLTGLADPNTSETTMQQAWVEYAKITEKIAESVEDIDNRYAKAQIAAIVHKAFILRTVHSELRYFEELDDAGVYARNMQLDPLSNAINEEIDRVSNLPELSPEVSLLMKLKGVISVDNYEFLRDLYSDGDDYEDMLNHAYGSLEFEGMPPEDILNTLDITES